MGPSAPARPGKPRIGFYKGTPGNAFSLGEEIVNGVYYLSRSLSFHRAKILIKKNSTARQPKHHCHDIKQDD